VLALCAIGLVLSFSRGAWLAAVLASALLVLVNQGAHLLRQKPWLMLVAVSVGLIVAAGALLARGTNVGSLDARVLFWHESLTWLQQRPWGHGSGQFYFYHNPEYGHSIIDPSLIGTSEQYAAHPHNLFLDLWLNLGSGD
jgi:O-antigen ligase